MVGSKRPVVLVVTNDRPLAQRSARTTQGRRFEMQFAATEKDALAALASASPAGIVVDLPLSEEQACGLCREIRACAAGSRAALVVVARGEVRFEALARLARPPEEIVRDPGSFADVLALTAEAIVVRERLGPLRDQVRRLETTIEERTATLERQIRFTGQIIDSLPVSLYVVDRGRTIVAWNRQREMGDQGLRREKALGRTLFDVFDHQSPDAIERELGPVFERSESLTIERETKIGGELRHFRIHKLPMHLEPGLVTHVLTIGEDITEQRRMEKSMVVTEKMAAMGRLAAGVAHEINNPLATIVTCAEGLENRVHELPVGTGADAEFLEYLQIVRHEAYRAKRITEDLLDFSRVRPSQRRVQSLEKILERTLVILKHHDGFKRIEVERRFEDGLPEVAVEEDAIVQAFVALIINALDAMPDGGRLVMTTASHSGEVRCEVRDTGCGIPHDDLAQIFEPFFTTKPPGRGTGLGLAVCYGIVKAHGGRIEVESAYGQGSRFTVVLPAADAGIPGSQETIACSLPSRSGF